MNTVITNNFPVILIFGPTAVGKTELLINIFNKRAEIIVADSMQVYREMDIGTAKPDREIFSKLRHHLIDIKNPRQQFNTAEFNRLADSLLTSIIKRGNIPVISGGTAFYFKNFLYGLPAVPHGDANIKNILQKELQNRGISELYEELLKIDPVYADKISNRDTHRILRAIEVYRISGRKLSSFSLPDRIRKQLNPLIIGLNRERKDLYIRIDARVEKMFFLGLIDEIKKLMQKGYSEKDPGMRGIGYSEFFLMRKTGCLSFSQVKELIKKRSRNYAKRQITFFKSFPGVKWFHPDEEEIISREIKGYLQKFK